MKNSDKWRPGKYSYVKGKLKGSRNILELARSSRLNADLIASRYDKYIPHYCKGRLLDLGCGKVPFYEAYKKYISENICIDWANTSHKNEYLDFEADLTKPLPFADNEFDTILLSDVLEHIPNPELIWPEMARILKPGGAILLNVPFFYMIHEKPFDHHRYTRYALEYRATQNNLRVEVIESIGGMPEVITDFNSKIAERLPLIGIPIVSFFQYLCRGFIRTRPGKKISAKTAESFPLGYFMAAIKSK